MELYGPEASVPERYGVKWLVTRKGWKRMPEDKIVAAGWDGQDIGGAWSRSSDRDSNRLAGNRIRAQRPGLEGSGAGNGLAGKLDWTGTDET